MLFLSFTVCGGVGKRGRALLGAEWDHELTRARDWFKPFPQCIGKMSHCVVWLCPLGGMTALRRGIIKERLQDIGFKMCGSQPTSDATHCVVDSGVTSGKFAAQGYVLPRDCVIFSDGWVLECLQKGSLAPATNFRHHV